MDPLSLTVGALFGGALLYVLQRRTGSNVNYKFTAKDQEVVFEKGAFIAVRFEVSKTTTIPKGTSKLVPLKPVKGASKSESRPAA